MNEGVPRCTKIKGCELDADHMYECQVSAPGGPMLINREMLEQEEAAEKGQPHYEDGWCRCTCTGCYPFGCSHESSLGESTCLVR